MWTWIEPPGTSTRASAPAPRYLRGNRLVLWAEGRHHRLAQQRVLGLLEPRVAGKQGVGAVGGQLKQRQVLGQARDLEGGLAVLARAEDVTLIAQVEIDLGEPEAVALACDCLEAGQLGIAEQDA